MALKMSESLEKLREITGTLPVVSSLSHLIKKETKGIISYKTIKGSMVANALLNIDEIAVAQTIFTENTVIDTHIHEESDEWVFVYMGELTIKTPEGEFKINNESPMFHVPTKQPHKVSSTEVTWAVVIAIPSDEGFPK